MGAARVAGAGIYVWQDVLSALVYAAQFRPDAYQTAILTGSHRLSGAGAATLVQGFSELATMTSPLAFAVETMNDWGMIINRLAHGRTTLRPAGWVSVRPGSRGIVDSREQFVHRSLFNLPWQLTLVLDPESEELGVWGAEAQGYLVNLGFNLVVDADEADGPNVQESE
jgi:hypothetical protein